MAGLVIALKSPSLSASFQAELDGAGIAWQPSGLPSILLVQWPDLQSFPLSGHSSVASIEDGDTPVSAARDITIDEAIRGPWQLLRHTHRVPPWDNVGLRLPITRPYSLARNGNGVDIYVIDTGIEIGHPEFGGRASIVWEFESTGGIGDDHGHGTSVASVAAGETCGFATSALLWSVKVLGSDSTGTTGNIVIGMGRALSHYNARKLTNPDRPAVANVSLAAPSALVGIAAADLIDAGMVVAAAAGNDGQDLSSISIYPAIERGVIACGGIQMGDIPYNTGTTSTNYGLSIDILAAGQSVWAAELRSKGIDYRAVNGTSFASPCVAGAVACILQDYRQPADKTQVQAIGIYLYEQATFGQYQQTVGRTPMTPAILYLEPSSSYPLVQGLTPRGTFAFVTPGKLYIQGFPPTISGSETSVPVDPGALVISGFSPSVYMGHVANITPGRLEVKGSAPLVYTQSSAVSSQVAMLSLSEVVPNAVASQIAALALAQPPVPPMRSSQIAALAVAEVVPDVCASQAAILVLGYASKCVTQNCQIWTITRRDGVVYRYTSLDRNLTYGGHVYKACGSMDPSASQNGATLGDVGSQSLSGLITDDGITEAELFGGLFDDAFVTTYLIDWSTPTIPPRRLASGWVGRVSQGPAFHTMEVLSVGARLEQTALVQVVSPSCRWQFGDSRCGVNVDAMKLPATIRRVINRGDLLLNIATPPDDGRIWASGRIRFLDGPCAGMVCEYKGVDFATGQIVLWSPAGLLPSAGNAVEVLPGCDLTRGGGCKAYNNRINFGGFADVPGADAILETPDAKI